MTRLILIHHCETDYNLQNRYCGFNDPVLNNKGIWQSKRLACRLKDVKMDKIYSSDLKRAYQTAKIIFKSNTIEKLKDFREMNFGLFEGLRYKDIIKRYRKLYGDWLCNPLKVKIPGGEGLIDLSKRVKERLSIIFAQREYGTIALVTHGGPIRIILCEALRLDLKMLRQIEQGFGALNIINYFKDSQPVVVKMNDMSHFSTQKTPL